MVSSVGLHLTSDVLLDIDLPAATQHKIDSLHHTDGHIFGFVGLSGETDDLSLPRTNTWLLPKCNVDQAMRDFQENIDAPFGYIGLAFPSAKAYTMPCSSPYTRPC